jgi:uridine kinase
MIIGIGGVSTAGKSSLAFQLRKYYSPKARVKILCQDDFIKPESEIPRIKQHIDWECPDSIDHEMYFHAIQRERKVNDIVISEGLFAFNDERVSSLYDKRIFLMISQETFWKRKSVDLRWGKEPEWYMEHIWNNYLKYGKIASERENVLRLCSDNKIELETVLEYLR